MENPYELVRDGKWTLDKMFKMGKTVAKDLNGDQKFDVDDSVGVIFEGKYILGLFYGTGQKLVSEDKNGELQLSFNTPKTVEYIDKMINYMNLDDGTFLLTEKIIAKAGALHQYQQMRFNFNEDKALFIISSLTSSCADLKLKETPFGILPSPKLDEEQEEYCSFLPCDVHMLAIPTVVEDIDKVGFILEAMAAESKYTTKVAAYDNMLITRQIRDTESEEMVNIINSNRMFDLGYIYNWGGVTGIIEGTIKSGKNTFNSTYEKSYEKIIKAIDKTMEMINEIG